MRLETAPWQAASDDARVAPAPGPAVAVAPQAPEAGQPGWLARVAARARAGGGRVRSRDVMMFARHLSALLDAGLPLAKSLGTLVRQFEGSRLGAVVAELAEQLEGGEMLSSAMAMEPDVFDALTVNIVRAGEVGGTLPETLAQLAEDLEKKDALRRTVVGALVYPAIVVVIATLVVVFVLIYVVPTFQDVYKRMNLELPLVTQLLLFASDMVLRYWWAGVLCIGAAVVGWKQLSARARFRRWRDGAVLRLPVFGSLARKSLAARILGTFATLIGSGVSIMDSLRLMASLTENMVVREAIEDMRRHVGRGGKLATPMQRHSYLLTPMTVQMMSVGQETGTMPEAAARAAKFLAEDVQQGAQTLTALLEPLLTVGLGVVVGTITLAVYLPMFDLMKHVSH